jgi:hypothetical protein
MKGKDLPGPIQWELRNLFGADFLESFIETVEPIDEIIKKRSSFKAKEPIESLIRRHYKPSLSKR